MNKCHSETGFGDLIKSIEFNICVVLLKNKVTRNKYYNNNVPCPQSKLGEIWISSTVQLHMV